jgi:hypothetical protein
VSFSHSTLRPQGVQCSGTFMSLDPAAREEHTSAQIMTCVVASPHWHCDGRWLNSGALYEDANWRWCGEGGLCINLRNNPFIRSVSWIETPLTLWVIALATINAYGCWPASRVRMGKPNISGGRSRLNLHKFFLCTCIPIGRIAGYARAYLAYLIDLPLCWRLTLLYLH